jgi:hypothetical protein
MVESSSPSMEENVTPHMCDCINVKLNKYKNNDCWSSQTGDSSYHLQLFIFEIMLQVTQS